MTTARPQPRRSSQRIPTTIAALLVSTLVACTESDDGQPPPAPPAFVLGSALEGLTQSEMEAFERGRAVFERDFKPSEGLGPFYNAVSCRSCHSTPVTGGGARLYRNFYIARIGAPGEVNLLTLPSPAVPAFGTGNHATAQFTFEGGRTIIPEEFFGAPITVTQRNAIPIFGVGLFEAVSNATIIGLSDPNDLDGDGISGRYNTEAGRIGRFGVKAQANNIESFTRAPLQNQMGITTDPFLGSQAVVTYAAHAAALQGTSNPDAPTADGDGIADPEMSAQDLGDLIAFTSLLAPPRKRAFDAAATRGESLFTTIGCAKCHVPSLPSSRGPVEAFTDLLLHDMGDELSDEQSFGIPQPMTGGPFIANREFRTQPLWGVSMTAPFLHDGRAETLDEAIRMHGGEAAAIRDAYTQLSATEQADIVAFLEHL